MGSKTEDRRELEEGTTNVPGNLACVIGAAAGRRLPVSFGFAQTCGNVVGRS